MKDYKIYQGDCRDELKKMKAKSVHCCVTSPPYWGQRDYGTAKWEGGDEDCDHTAPPVGGWQAQVDKGSYDGEFERGGNVGQQFRNKCKKCGAKRIDDQMGLEKTPDEYVAMMVQVFREVKRVLRDDGTLWLNLGSTYQNKQLIAIPWLVAFALQKDGWVLRSDIIWSKPNPMPGSQRDRPTTAHEYIFLLVKQPKYFYDDVAVRERSMSEPHKPGWSTSMSDRNDRQVENEANKREWAAGGFSTKRSVWTIPIQPESESHFAVFPPKLIMPCILAGTSKHGCCKLCGAPWQRMVEREYREIEGGKTANRDMSVGQRHGIGGKDMDHFELLNTKTTGWESTCNCNTTEVKPCVVLDPFMGSGTTLCVALRKNRRAIGIELNAEYINIAKRKIKRALRKKGFGI